MDSFIQVAPDSTGKKVDNSQLTVGSDTVYRQRVILTDNTAAAGIAPVSATTGLLVNVSNAYASNVVGAWTYQTIASGSLVVAANRRVVGITAHATTAGTLTINGGDSIIIPAGTSISFSPQGNLVAPTLVATGTDSVICESVL